MTRPPRTPTGARWRTLIGAAVCAAWLAMPAAQTPATDVPARRSGELSRRQGHAARRGSIRRAHRSRDRARLPLLPPAGAGLVVPDLPRVRATCAGGCRRWPSTATRTSSSSWSRARASAWRTSTCRASARRSWTWCATPRRCTWPVARCRGPVTATPPSRPTSPPITRPSITRSSARGRRWSSACAPRSRRNSETWLRWADTLMKPLPAAQEASLRDGWGRFIDLMLETRPERPQRVLSARAGRPHRDGHRQRARTEDPGCESPGRPRRRTTT